MNRRQLMIGTGAAVGALRFAINPTSAQEAEATPTTFNYEFEGKSVGVTRQWQSARFRFDGAMRYSTTVDVFEDAADAKAAFEHYDTYITKFIEFALSQGNPVTVGVRRELSAPDLGDDRIAEMMTFDVDGTSLELVMLFAYKDAILHKWTAIGFVNPTDELFDLAVQYMKFEDADFDSDYEDLFALLPTLDDMPEGFALLEEDSYREEEEVVTPTS